MRFWKLFLEQRVIQVDGFTVREKLMELDGVGFFYKYNEEKELDPDFIRRHLHFREETWTVVDAPTVKQAIEAFYREWGGAKTSGAAEKAKALWVDRMESIIELPPCELLCISKEKRFICGEEKANGNGEFGMCVIEGFDAPDGCAIAEHGDRIYELKEANALPVSTIVVDGKEFKYVTVEDVRHVHAEMMGKKTVAEVVK